MTRLPWFLAACLSVAAQTHTEVDFARQADERVQVYVKENKFSGSVLVARQGRPVFQKAYGMANREWDVPNTLDSKFRLGSITKQFTATLILHLAEQGKLKLDDPVSKYYSDAPAAWSKITIHHLLTHTSGVPSYTGIPKFFEQKSRDPLKPMEIVKLTQDMPLEFEPGTKFSYDNTGYILLGYVIEKVTGESYASYLKKTIFDPLGMSNSGYDEWTPIIPHRAAGYMMGDHGIVNAAYLDMTLPYAAGPLYSTVGDLLVWDQALYGNKLLNDDSKRKMFTPFLENYAYGWFIDSSSKHKHVGHGGGINGFNTDIERYPDEKLTVIALSNLNSDSLTKITTDLATLAFGEKIPDPPAHKEIKLETKVLDTYVGRYEHNDQFGLDITRDGEQLFVQATNQGKFPLFAESDRMFFLKVVDAQLEFSRDSSGKVTGALLHQNGANLHLDRK